MSTIVPKWLRNMSTHEFAGKLIHNEVFISCVPRSKMWNCELCSGQTPRARPGAPRR